MSKSILLHSELELLNNWGYQCERMFKQDTHYGLFHVGSSTRIREYRDVDVRLIMTDYEYKKLKQMIDMEYLRLGISLWGQRATGLPIDFDIQPMSYANAKYSTANHERNPIGIKVSLIHEAVRKSGDSFLPPEGSKE